MRALYKLFVLFLCMYVVDTVGKNCEFFMKKFSETLTFLRQSVCANKRPFSFLISLNVHILLLPKHDSNILAFFVIIHNFSWSTCQYFVSRNLIHTSSEGTIWDRGEYFQLFANNHWGIVLKFWLIFGKVFLEKHKCLVKKS